MPFAKGNRVGKGRPKGTPNKVTASVKGALTEAFDRRGGVPALLEWADENPSAFYALWGRLAPHEVSGPEGGPVAVNQEWTIGNKSVKF